MQTVFWDNPDLFRILMAGFNFTIVLIFFFLSIINSRKIRILSQKYKRFMQLSGEASIEKVLADCISYINEIKKSEREINVKINNIERQLIKCIQKVEIQRYRAFEEVGGDLSFVLALLDGNNDGVTVNSIYSREGSSVYAKQIKAGKSKQVLSAEEEMIVEKATKTRAE